MNVTQREPSGTSQATMAGRMMRTTEAGANHVGKPRLLDKGKRGTDHASGGKRSPTDKLIARRIELRMAVPSVHLGEELETSFKVVFIENEIARFPLRSEENGIAAAGAFTEFGKGEPLPAMITDQLAVLGTKSRIELFAILACVEG